MVVAILATVGLGAAWIASRGDEELEVVSGRAQPKTTRSGHAVRWWSDQVPITIDASVAAMGPGATDAVVHAFGSWLAADPLPRFQLDSRASVPISAAPDGENRVYYGPITIEGHETDLAVTVSYTDESTGRILEADIIINSLQPVSVLEVATATVEARDERGTAGEREWDEDPPGSSHRRDDEERDDREEGTEPAGRHLDDGDDGREGDREGERAPTATDERTALAAVNCARHYDLESVVAHEVGHFLGLGEDMTDSSATMYARTGRCEVNKRRLSTADAAAVSALYAEPVPLNEGPASAASCGIGRPTPMSGVPAGLLGGWLIAAWIARARWARPRAHV